MVWWGIRTHAQNKTKITFIRIIIFWQFSSIGLVFSGIRQRLGLFFLAVVKHWACFFWQMSTSKRPPLHWKYPSNAPPYFGTTLTRPLLSLEITKKKWKKSHAGIRTQNLQPYRDTIHWPNRTFACNLVKIWSI